MLERVPLLHKELANYEDVVGAEVIDRIRALAAPLRGKRVLHLNATAYGGGVAELLATHVPLLVDLGLDAEWHVMEGSDEFFAVTKGMHNALQGASIPWTHDMQRIYLERVLANATDLADGWDYVVIHDPQPAGILSFLEGSPVARQLERAKWIWRCHIDLTAANPDVWGFLAPFISHYDASIWTMEEFIPDGFDRAGALIAPPTIDPLSVKNLELQTPFVDEICRQYGLDPHRPIVCQVSRYDPWKDPVGVIQAFRLVRDEVPGAQLLLAGSMATDDPEGFHYWQLTEEAAGGDPDIFLLSNIQQVGAVQINAFQRAAGVVIQKSLREGFGLTVSEGLWKGRPVVGGRAGGITLQIENGVNGYLVDSVEECAARTIELLQNPGPADGMGEAGREKVRQEFVSTRELEDYLRLFADLDASR